MYTGKLPFPRQLCKVPCTVTVYSPYLSEDTGAKEVRVEYSGKCIWSEKAKNVTDAEKNIIRLSGTIILEGDIAPEEAVFSGGTVTVYPGLPYERILTIYEGKRPRNPDGTIHHTSLGVI